MDKREMNDLQDLLHRLLMYASDIRKKTLESTCIGIDLWSHGSENESIEYDLWINDGGRHTYFESLSDLMKALEEELDE